MMKFQAWSPLSKGYQTIVLCCTYFGHSFVGVPRGPKKVLKVRSHTHCSPLTANSKKLFLSAVVELLVLCFWGRERRF